MNKSDCPTICEVTMTDKETQASAGVASVLNAELDLCDNKAHIMRVMTSSEDMTWATPQKWFDYLNLEFGFTLDPCCLLTCNR